MAVPSRRLPGHVRKGSADLLILALVEDRARHGYDIGRLIGERSDGELTYHVASLYPTLYRLEHRGLVEGRWVEKAGQRRRRYYRITAKGRRTLAKERSTWQRFFAAIDRVAGIRHA
jgi:PadR family transcriptional regulator